MKKKSLNNQTITTSETVDQSESNSQQDTSQDIYAHFSELRKRLWISLVFFILSMIFCYYFIEDIFNVLIYPLDRAMSVIGGTKRMIFTNLTEGFIVYLKLAGFGGIVLSFPVWIWQLWKFISPALYKREKRKVLPFLIISPFLFITGALFVYFLIVPLAWQFLIGFQSQTTLMPIELEARISDYLSLITSLIIVFGFCFQLPVILVLLMRFKIINVSSLVKFRKFVIVGIFIIAAFVTPPDVISQIALAIPLLLMYEIAILIEKGNKNV